MAKTFIKFYGNILVGEIVSGTIAPNKWVGLSNGHFVSTERMPYENGRVFTLHLAGTMNVDVFNSKANRYDVSISHGDPPIVKFIKYSIYCAGAREGDKGSFIPTNEQYVDMAIIAASADTKGEEPLSSFYVDTFLHQCPESPGNDVTRDILEFQEKIKSGSNRNKYLFTLLKFNKDCIPEPLENIIIPSHDGHIWELGTEYKYPVKVGDHSHFDMKPIRIPNHNNMDIMGYFIVGKEPKKGERRLVMHYPNQWSLDRLPISIDVSENWLYSGHDTSALRMKGRVPID